MEGLGEKILTQGLPFLLGLVITWFALKLFIRITALLLAAAVSGLLTYVFLVPLNQFSIDQLGPFSRGSNLSFLQKSDPLWLCIGGFFLLTFVINAILLSKVIRSTTA